MALFMVWPLRKASQDDPSRALRACFAFYPFQLPTNLTVEKLMFFLQTYVMCGSTHICS
jgi:hypothetical protein